VEPTGGEPVAPAPAAGAAAGAAAAGAGAEAAGARAEGAGGGAAAPTEGRAPLQVPPSFGGNMVHAASHRGCAPTGAAMPCGSQRGRHAQRFS